VKEIKARIGSDSALRDLLSGGFAAAAEDLKAAEGRQGEAVVVVEKKVGCWFGVRWRGIGG